MKWFLAHYLSELLRLSMRISYVAIVFDILSKTLWNALHYCVNSLVSVVTVRAHACSMAEILFVTPVIVAVA